MASIDNEQFIQLVSERDVLWDNTLESYKDKRKTLQAWHVICESLFENFQAMSDGEKKRVVKYLIQKWKNMRDSWMRCHKKISECKPGSGAMHKYTYYDNMLFLMKITTKREISIEDQPDLQIVVSKRRKLNEASSSVDNRTPYLGNGSEQEEKNGRMMSFFRGIAPTVEQFCDEDIVEFQYQVMTIIRGIQKKNQNLINSNQYGYPILAQSLRSADNSSFYDRDENSLGFGYSGAESSRQLDQSSNDSTEQQMQIIKNASESFEIDFKEHNIKTENTE